MFTRRTANALVLGPSATPVVIVSERAVRELFGPSGVVGRQVLRLARGSRGSPDRDAFTVVGVARNVEVPDADGRQEGRAYVPFAHTSSGTIEETARCTRVAALSPVIGRAGVAAGALGGAKSYDDGNEPRPSETSNTLSFRWEHQRNCELTTAP